MGFDQTASGIGGVLSGLNTLFGSGGMFGSGGAGSGLGSLFGSGLGADAGGLAAATDASIADVAAGGVGLANVGGGGAGKAAASAIPFLSDRRLKSDIEKLGEIHPGLGVYRFRYADPTIRIGLMADEVEQFRPDAVFTLPGASRIKMVDYARALE